VEFIDPLVRLNCPWCGQQMHYESTARDAQFYFCFKHERVALRANWQFALAPDDGPCARAEDARAPVRSPRAVGPALESSGRLAT
jgi:hypothetical protein